jgi:hypothetical protein
MRWFTRRHARCYVDAMVENPVDFESCAVCERTILRGERMSEYVTPDGEHLRICSLCRARAEAAGWIPAERVATHGRGPTGRRRRGLALRELWARATERMRQPLPAPREAVASPGEVAAGSGRREASRDDRETMPRAGRGSLSGGEDDAAATPPAAGRGPATHAGRRMTPNGAKEKEPSKPSGPEPAAESAEPPKPKPRPVPDTPERRMRRAVERFNESEHPRVVAGLVRSLGEPRASVRNVAGMPRRVLITVAWELSWYRWEVGLNGEGSAIREVDKGSELHELDEAERKWNAKVGDDGQVRLERAAARRAKTASE